MRTKESERAANIVPGMSTGLQTNDTTVVAAFHSALLHQGLIVLLILAVAGVTLNVLRSLQFRAVAGGKVAQAPTLPERGAESPARRLLRISFGLLWIFDGILQGQSSMPLGMVPQAIRPTAAASPTWVQHVVNAGTTIWSYHPVQAAAATVWIQVGIGVWLLVVPRGRWSRLGGVASLGWGVVVWIFGEAFGGIFAPGLTWLFGAPGAVLFYCVAGVLIALPEHAWSSARPGRIILRGVGLFFVGMAILQAWPGRGFWAGVTRSGGVGTLAGMVQGMSQTPQPHVFSSWVSSFETFDAAHGWGVNLFVVIALAAAGAGFIVARPPIAASTLIATIVLCMADWLLVEDIGFFGGVGTDPEQHGAHAVRLRGRLPRSNEAHHPAEPGRGAHRSAVGTTRPRGIERVMTNPGYAFRGIAALCAIGIVLVGVVADGGRGGQPECGSNSGDRGGRSAQRASTRQRQRSVWWINEVSRSRSPVFMARRSP